ncbi:MAG: hypothetical protein JWR44_1718 [Hymenobacter sp.]|nr:hypothetical protein [Hymenobacter sp.]
MKKQFAVLGMAGGVLSSATLIGMAALRTDGYSHLTKAVSELGSVDAPHRAWFNWLGYIGPGMLIAAFSYGLSRSFTGPASRKLPFVLLGLSGLLMALAGICPVDMDHRDTSSSLLHAVGSLGSGLAWLGCAITIGLQLRQEPAWADLRQPLWGLVGLAVVLVLLVGVALPDTPGLGQRISFAAYFLFVGVLARRLYAIGRSEAVSGK